MTAVEKIHSSFSSLLPTLQKDTLIAIIACLSYATCSITMTLTNKAMFSTFSFRYPLCLLMYQHIFTVVFLYLGRKLGYLHYEPLNWTNVKNWYPVNILFLLMLASGSYVIKLLSIPMVTIFKNVTTSLVTAGDYVLFGEVVTQGIFSSVLLMIASSIVAGLNDLAFNALGYLWMSVNCFVSAAYVLYMRHAMKTTKLSEWSMVYYNNLLSIPTLLPVLYLNGELPALLNEPLSMWTNGLVTMTFISGISGVLISVTSFWAVKSTSPTTFSMVGTLNKIPLTLLGFMFFHSPVTLLGAISISLGLVGGALFTYTKQQARAHRDLLPQKMPEKNSKV